jgi:hypothetical protein
MLQAHIAHETPYRLRLRIETLRGDVETCAALKRNLSADPAFSAVEVRVNTGSIVLHYEGKSGAALAAIAPFIEIHAAAEDNAPPPKPPIQSVMEATRTMDAALKASSGGRLSLADAGFVALCTTAVVQAARGYVSMPAIGLLMSAASLAAHAGADARRKN